MSQVTLRHPAKYSNVLLPIFERLLDGYERVLDPFAGTGKLRLVRPDAELLEIEPKWAKQWNLTLGDALALPWDDASFDAVCTSPTYGNRMADHHEAKDASRRNTYRHALGEALQPNNSGALQWGDAYREFHALAWAEVKRVLRPGGRFILNIKDHIRKGERMLVTDWHLAELETLRFVLEERIDVETPGQRFGQNGSARIPYESILVLRKSA